MTINSRRGTVLVLVLVVIAMLTLGAYTFSELMLTEYRAVSAYGRQTQSHAWAQSGVEYVAALLSPDGGGWESDLYHNPALFHYAVSGDGGFTVVAPLEDVTISTQSRSQGNAVLRMGLIDESSRINLNALALLDPSDGVARQMLLALPNITEEIADSILDWIDSDDDPREYGKEFDSYQTILPRNGPLESLEELLLIEGVTPWLLYGEDTNRNGLLDPNENDGEKSLPSDNEDDLLDLGWADYLTLTSIESNLRHASDAYGEARVNVNQELLTDLYDELEEKFDADVAQFVAAFRLKGPYNGEASASSDSASGGSSGTQSSSGSGQSQGGGGTQGGSSQGGQGSQSGSGSGSSSGSGTGSGSSGQSSTGSRSVELYGLWRPSLSATSSSGPTSTGNAETDSALLDAANSLANVLGGGDGAVTRGGLDLSQGGSTQIRSVYELLGSQVQVEIDGQVTILDSPWPSDPGNLQMSLADLLDRLTITTEETIAGRININEASLSVLRMIPDMPDDLPDRIVSTRSQRFSQNGVASDRFTTAGWLLIEGLVDVPTMVELDSSITARGDVFRIQVIGHADREGPMTRIEAVIDASTAVPKIIQQRSLSRLGPGYQRNELPAFGASAAQTRP
ncbi:MAG TPA: hypothetical protein VNQ76_13770 [Planctomicrobium sp.]|nr:hypothetical protein [Planctomicrobium sp.]